MDVSTPTIIYISFSIAWLLYAVVNLHMTSAIQAFIYGGIGALMLEYISRSLGQNASYFLISLPALFLVVILAILTYTSHVAVLNSTVERSCPNGRCIRGNWQQTDFNVGDDY